MTSNAGTMIAAYESSFGELKIEFIMGSTLQTALTTVRILEKVENIGMPSYSLIRTLPSFTISSQLDQPGPFAIHDWRQLGPVSHLFTWYKCISRRRHYPLDLRANFGRQ